MFSKKMLVPFKNLLFTFIFNFCLFFILFIGIQNSSKRSRVNFLINETLSMPISFIVGTGFICGSFTGGILTTIFRKNKN